MRTIKGILSIIFVMAIVLGLMTACGNGANNSVPDVVAQDDVTSTAPPIPNVEAPEQNHDATPVGSSVELDGRWEAEDSPIMTEFQGSNFTDYELFSRGTFSVHGDRIDLAQNIVTFSRVEENTIILNEVTFHRIIGGSELDGRWVSEHGGFIIEFQGDNFIHFRIVSTGTFSIREDEIERVSDPCGRFPDVRVTVLPFSRIDENTFIVGEEQWRFNRVN